MDESVQYVVSQQCSQLPEPEAPVRPRFPTQESVQENNDVHIDTNTSHPTQESSTVLKDRVVPSIGASVGVPRPRFEYLASYTNHSLIPRTRERIPEYESLVNEKDILLYDISSPVGYAALFCNDQSSYNREPLPVFKDLNHMFNALHNCNWKVQLYPKSPSMTLDDCKKRLQTIVDWNYDEYSCFMFYYSGHGTSNGLLLSDGCCMRYSDIVDSIASINSLDGKPKLFIFDSCRKVPQKPKEKHGILKNLFHKEKIESETDIQNKIPVDTLICFSTNEGTESYSGDNVGSLFTTRLTKMLEKFWRKLTFTEIVTLAHGWTIQLAQNYKLEQQPVMESSLTRLLLLDSKKLFWFK